MEGPGPGPGTYLGDELVDDRLLLDADGDGEEAFRLPAAAVLLPFRVATQRLHLEVGLVLNDAPRQGLAAWRSTFILKKSFQHKEFSVSAVVKLSSAVNFSWTTWQQRDHL